MDDKHSGLHAELVFWVLVVVAAASAWYDFSVDGSNTISVCIDRWSHKYPAVAYLGGVLTTFAMWGIHRAWRIKLRYVVALVAAGGCLGHLFWAQH